MKNFFNKCKKLFMILLIVPVMFIFSACGKDKNNDTTETPSTETEQPVTPTPTPGDGGSGNGGSGDSGTGDNGGESGGGTEDPQPEPVSQFSVNVNYNLPEFIRDLLPAETKTAAVDEGYTLPTFENTEYLDYFDGWYNSVDEKIETAKVLAEKDATVSIYAKWKTSDMRRYFCTAGVEFELFADGGVQDNPYAVVKGYEEGTNSIVVIPQDVVVQGVNYYVDGFKSSAFKDNKVVKEIRTNLTEFVVGESAFEGSSLEKIDFEKMISVDAAAFKNSSVSGEVEFTNKLISISQSAFYGCENITAVDFSAITNISITKVAAHMFYGCSNLESVELADSMAAIDANAFNGCAKLTSFDFVKNSSVVELGNNSFANCKMLDNITISDRFVPRGTSIFDGCEITTMTLSKLFYNDGYAVNSFTSWYGDLSETLETLTLNGTVSTINKEYFKNYSALKTLDMSTVVEIKNNAFKGCTNLENIAFSTDDEFNGDNINIAAFVDTKWYSNLENSQYDFTVLNDSLVYVKNSVAGEFEIAPTVKFVCKNVFAGKTGITSVVIPESVQEIHYTAFKNSSVKTIGLAANNDNFILVSNDIIAATGLEEQGKFYALYTTTDGSTPVNLIAYVAESDGGIFVVDEAVSKIYDEAISSVNAPDFVYVSSNITVICNGKPDAKYVFESTFRLEGVATGIQYYKYLPETNNSVTYYTYEEGETPVILDYSKLTNNYMLIVITNSDTTKSYYLVDKLMQTVTNITDLYPNFAV